MGWCSFCYLSQKLEALQFLIAGRGKQGVLLFLSSLSHCLISYQLLLCLLHYGVLLNLSHIWGKTGFVCFSLSSYLQLQIYANKKLNCIVFTFLPAVMKKILHVEGNVTITYYWYLRHPWSQFQPGADWQQKQPRNFLSNGPSLIQQMRTDTTCLSINESFIKIKKHNPSICIVCVRLM